MFTKSTQNVLYNKSVELFGSVENVPVPAKPIVNVGRKINRSTYRYNCIFNRLAAKGYSQEACKEIAFKSVYCTSKEALLDTFAAHVKAGKHPLNKFLMAHWQMVLNETYQEEPMLFPTNQPDEKDKQIEALTNYARNLEEWIRYINPVDPEDEYLDIEDEIEYE